MGLDGVTSSVDSEVFIIIGLLVTVGLNMTIMVAVATLIGFIVLIGGLLLVHRSVRPDDQLTHRVIGRIARTRCVDADILLSQIYVACIAWFVVVCWPHDGC